MWAVDTCSNYDANIVVLFEEKQRINSRHDSRSIFSRESIFSLNHVVMSVIQMDFDSHKVERTCTPGRILKIIENKRNTNLTKFKKKL